MISRERREGRKGKERKGRQTEGEGLRLKVDRRRICALTGSKERISDTRPLSPRIYAVYLPTNLVDQYASKRESAIFSGGGGRRAQGRDSLCVCPSICVLLFPDCHVIVPWFFLSAHLSVCLLFFVFE
mmetsp:Transcript_6778/g.13357  ORF Transcript_6778/g.13357 Transcript_6778/m.13357 type:complete len:128 (+) Transcript_6778:1570-1953(+)